MLIQLLEQIRAALRDNGAEGVYTAFDAGYTERKGRGIFTLLSIDALEMTDPVLTQYTVYFPFKCRMKIDVTAPDNCRLESLYAYFDKVVLPAMDSLTGLSSRMTGLSMKHDTNMSRLVLSAGFQLSGIRAEGRDTE